MINMADNDSKKRGSLRRSFLVEAYEKHLNKAARDYVYEDDFFVYQPDDIEVMNQVEKMLRLCVAAGTAVPLFITAAIYSLLGLRTR